MKAEKNGFPLIIKSFCVRDCKIIFFLRFSYVSLSVRPLSVHCSTYHFKRGTDR